MGVGPRLDQLGRLAALPLPPQGTRRGRLLCVGIGTIQRIRLAGGTGLRLEDQFLVKRGTTGSGQLRRQLLPIMNERFMAIVPLGPGTRVRPRSGCTLETIALAGDV